ncbi:MAB_1171c family putative transporter [Micromonospora sp. NPDC005215]|uniref:MAB_1171c family putative transporter n=1 Tax=Micromonospora sp. NPDC005215 TaxID=3157024 RepID=UPI0033AD85C3
MSGADLIEIVAIGALWLVLAIQVGRSRQSPRDTWAFLLQAGLAVAATLNLAAVSRVIDATTGLVDLSVLVKNMAGLTVAYLASGLAAAIATTTTTTPATGYRPRAGLLLPVGAVIGMCFLFAAAPHHPGGDDFVTESAKSPYTVWYGILYQSAIVSAVVRALLTIWKLALTRSGSRGNWSVVVTALGGSVLLVYILNRIAFILSHAAHIEILSGPGYVFFSKSLFGVGLTLLAIGSAVPVSRPARRYIRDIMRLHRLYRMWHTLQLAVPDVVLGAPPSRIADVTNVLQVRLRLYRRVIEIRDAQSELATFVGASTVSAAQAFVERLGLTGESAEAAIEACWTAAGLRFKSERSVESGGTFERSVESGGIFAFAGSAAVPDLDSDVESLLRVRSFYFSPAIRKFVGSPSPAERPSPAPAVDERV